MGRGRGKGKKQNARDDAESGEEEKIPASKRRGRPQRPLKNDEDGNAEIIDDDAENAKSSITNKDGVDQTSGEDAKKRKKSSELREGSDFVDDKKASGAKSTTVTDDSVKFVGFRPNGSRRKGKPCRAAEVGVGLEF